MKCSECAEASQVSKVFSRGSTSTLLGYSGSYWDEDGVRHDHDPNTITSGFECGRGHLWAVKSKRRCPAADCDYGKQLAAKGMGA